MKMKSNRRRVVLTGLLALGLSALIFSGCGPISALNAISQAQTSLQAARDVQGWKYGCYEYYAAMRLLYRARIEAGYSDFEAATDYADKATKYAQRAQAIARLHRTRGSRTSLTKFGARIVHEAKGQVRVICEKPPVMKTKYLPKKNKK